MHVFRQALVQRRKARITYANVIVRIGFCSVGLLVHDMAGGFVWNGIVNVLCDCLIFGWQLKGQLEKPANEN